MYVKYIATLLRNENRKILLQKRHVPLEVFCISKYSTNTGKKANDQYDDELDKPIRFSTSKAAALRASYEAVDNKNPKYQEEIVWLSTLIFLLYFTIFREENDIDELMMKDIPVEVRETIYGKEAVHKNKFKHV